jgi:ribosomal protein S12
MRKNCRVRLTNGIEVTLIPRNRPQPAGNSVVMVKGGRVKTAWCSLKIIRGTLDTAGVRTVCRQEANTAQNDQKNKCVNLV